MNDVIETQNLTKEFDGLVAVDHIDLSVKQGEIFGFLGPNGAGKTTTIRMLCTILDPTSGWAKVCGYDVARQRMEVRECIGIVFQDSSIDKFLTGKENLNFHAQMYHMDKKTREERMDEVLSLLDLEGTENTVISNLSGGMQRKFEVARGFINHPKVLFLDEPTLGLDIHTRRSLWAYIQMLNSREGTTIILTTHYIEEADYLCNRVAIMDRGKIMAIDEPNKLKEAVGVNLISLRITNGDDGIVNSLRELSWVRKIEAHSGMLELDVDGGDERIPELIDFADENGFAISSIDLRQPSLEDAFLYHTGREIREEKGNLMELWKGVMMRRRGRK